MTREERNAARAHVIVEHLNAPDDLGDHHARYSRILCPILKAAEADRNGSLSILSREDHALVDTATDATFRIPEHAEVVAAIQDLATAQQPLAKTRAALERAGIDLEKLASDG